MNDMHQAHFPLTTAQPEIWLAEAGAVPRELARDAGTTLPQLLTALVVAYLHRITGTTDLVVGSPVTRMMRPDALARLGPILAAAIARTRQTMTSSREELLP